MHRLRCFESAEAAAANSNRPEQAAWWNETEKYYNGDVTFHDCTDVETYFAGSSPSSRFVQVMRGSISNRARLKELEDSMMHDMPRLRPDLLGSVRAHYGNGQYYEFIYFTSEAEARTNEAKPMPDDVMAIMNDWQTVSTVDEWFDLTDPWIQ